VFWALNNFGVYLTENEAPLRRSDNSKDNHSEKIFEKKSLS
jgi:hypothetical protein